MLEIDENSRLARLFDEWLEPQMIVDIVGIDPMDSFIGPSLGTFAGRLRRKHADSKGKFSRHVVEVWLQHHRLLPMHAAALQVGMTEDSLRTVLAALFDTGLVANINTSLPPSLIGEDVIRSFHRSFGTLQGRIFSDQSDFCDRLHEAVKQELSVQVTPVFCTVSEVLDRQEPDYAYYRCAVSHQPVGLRYAEAIDTKKPLRLPPDEVSWLTLCRGYDEIAPHLMGTAPDHAQLKAKLGDACR